MQKIRIVVIDSQEIVRMGIRNALATHEQTEIVAEGATEIDARHLVCKHRPDVLLYGLNTVANQQPCSIALSTRDLIRELLQICDTHVLVLCRYAHQVLIRAVVRAGANGFMLKEEALVSCSRLVEAVVTMVRKGKRPFLPALSHQNLYLQGMELDEIPNLTKRRIEIMQAIADNPQLTLTQVAELLGIAESTLRNNLSAISRALNTPNINGAMIECLRLGVVRISD